MLLLACFHKQKTHAQSRDKDLGTEMRCEDLGLKRYEDMGRCQ